MLGELLRLAATAGPSDQRWRSWVKALATSRGAGPYDAERFLIEDITDRLDVVAENETTFRTLAMDMSDILGGIEEPSQISALVQLAESRVRFSSIAKKHVAGVVTRVSFLSYLAEQPWPAELKGHISILAHRELNRLIEAVQIGDWRAVSALLNA